MIGFTALIKTWWPALLVLAMGLALLAFEFYIRNDERTNVKKDIKIEKLENENKNINEVLTIRTKQNEIRNNRPDTDDLVDSLRNNTF